MHRTAAPQYGTIRAGLPCYKPQFCWVHASPLQNKCDRFPHGATAEAPARKEDSVTTLIALFAGLPLIGSILHVASDPPKVFAKWSQEYGDTIAVKLGSQTMVIMHDYETAKAVMNEENVAGRDQTFEQAKINDNNGGED